MAVVGAVVEVVGALVVLSGNRGCVVDRGAGGDIGDCCEKKQGEGAARSGKKLRTRQEFEKLNATKEKQGVCASNVARPQKTPYCQNICIPQMGNHEPRGLLILRRHSGAVREDM